MNRTQTSELASNGEDLSHQIAQRAYALYEQRGRQDGFAIQDWLQAEQELAPARANDLNIDRSIAFGLRSRGQALEWRASSETLVAG